MLNIYDHPNISLTVLLMSYIHKNIIFSQVMSQPSFWCQLIVDVESKTQSNEHRYFPIIPSLVAWLAWKSLNLCSCFLKKCKPSAYNTAVSFPPRLHDVWKNLSPFICFQLLDLHTHIQDLSVCEFMISSLDTFWSFFFFFIFPCKTLRWLAFWPEEVCKFSHL